LRILEVVHHRNAAMGVFADAAAGHERVEWLPHEAAPPALDGFDAAFVLGAEAQVDQEGELPWIRTEKQLVGELVERGTPVLGVCFGSQLLADLAGAPVRHADQPEIGWHGAELTREGKDDPLLGFLADRFETLQWHHYEWLLPDGAVALARSARCLQAFRLADRPVWGVQFHPEVTEADYGEWLDNWHEDAGAVATGADPEAIRAETAAKIGAWNEVGRELARRFLNEADPAQAAEPPA
jgi:GMP synthase-like glutamine amidotransferase